MIKPKNTKIPEIDNGNAHASFMLEDYQLSNTFNTSENLAAKLEECKKSVSEKATSAKRPEREIGCNGINSEAKMHSHQKHYAMK